MNRFVQAVVAMVLVVPAPGQSSKAADVVAVPEPEAATTWLDFMGATALFVLGLLALVLATNGWGRLRRLDASTPGAATIVRVWHVLLPATIMFGAICVLFVVDLAFHDSDSAWVDVITVLGGSVSLGSGLWGLKELLRPSAWRRIPQWMYSQGLVRRTNSVPWMGKP